MPTALPLLAPAEGSSLFDTIGDLPLHPLVVHVAVVILPLAALALIAIVAVPRWRRPLGWLTMAGLLVGLGGAFAAKESGEALAARVGLPQDHARLGDILPLVAGVLFVLAVAWFLLDRRATRAGGRTPTGVTILGIIAAVVAVGTIVLTVMVGHSGATAVWAGRIASTAPTDSSTGSAPAPSASPAADAAAVDSAGLTMTDVQAHATASDCWSAVNGNVYDLTDWISRHPGGAADIEAMCGIDASSAFDAQHAGQAQPEQELAQFLVGPLG